MFEKESVENIIERALRNKLQNYNPEPSYMPFHTSLLGKDRMALYSFIHSLSTNFGTAIFENVAKEIATGVFNTAELQFDIPVQFQNTNHIIPSGSSDIRRLKRLHQKNPAVFSHKVQEVITQIMNGLKTNTVLPNHATEFARISEIAQSQDGEPVTTKLRKVDIFLSRGNYVFMINLKTVKPNVSGFEKYKQDMLEWVAAILYKDLNAVVRTIIAMPYNPYYPETYKRWTLGAMLETKNQSQLMVGEEFWNFLAGGEEIYQDLLTCFESVGLRMREEIDDYFKNLGERTYR